jgi:hypothetical protein
VTQRTGGDLLYRRLTAGETRGIIVRGQIADESSRAVVCLLEQSERLFKEGSLAGAGA